MIFKEKIKLLTLPVDKILPNPSQPRRVFPEKELYGLAVSIRENGVLQPVTVRRVDGTYFLVAGERRLRASKLAGLSTIPAVLSEYSNEESEILALLENIQRQDLNMFEQANAIVNLLRHWNISQEQAARRLGISQSYLANKLRLLKLEPQEQEEILENHLTERHARALLKVADMNQRQRILMKVIEKQLNVRQTEEWIYAAIEEQEIAEESEKKKPVRTFVAKDIRIFINTIDHAVTAMKTAGIQAQSERTETEDFIECTVRIPKRVQG